MVAESSDGVSVVVALFDWDFESVSDVVVDEISPISLKIKELLEDKVFLEKIVKDGHEKANEIASKKVKEIHKIMGF